VRKTIRGTAVKLSRRTFIVGSSATGGLALGFRLPSGFDSALAQGANDGAEVNAWVFVKPDDTCVIRVARSEMGQGTITGLVQLEVRSGTTPATITARLFTSIVRPINVGSLPKRLRQTDSATITDGVWPGVRQSSAVRSLPAMGRSRPSTVKKLHETRSPDDPA